MDNPRKMDGFTGERMFVLPTESFAEYVEHPLVRRLYLTDIGYFPHAARHYRERPAGTEEYILLYCTEGKGTVEIGGVSFALREQEALCIPKQRGHRYFADEEQPWSLLWVHFKGEDVKFYPLEECRLVRAGQEQAERISGLFDRLLYVLDDTYTLDHFIYISQILGLLLTELYHGSGEREELPNRYVTEIVHYLYEHLDANLTLDELSAQFSLSKSYLNLIFRQATGRSPMDFYTHLRMKKACRLLRTTSLYTYEIARELGYPDPYYFSRVFTKTIGAAPREYRKDQG